MKRVLIILIICFAFLITVQAQTDNPLKKGMVNTVELSNGDVIYDLNGEWEVSVEHYGPWAQFGVVSDISAIKQDGASFVGVTLLGSPRSPKGSEKLRGELDKSGGPGYIATLTSSVPTAANVSYYAKIVSECVVRS